jgi:hypothetical protein
MSAAMLCVWIMHCCFISVFRVFFIVISNGSDISDTVYVYVITFMFRSAVVLYSVLDHAMLPGNDR